MSQISSSLVFEISETFVTLQEYLQRIEEQLHKFEQEANEKLKESNNLNEIIPVYVKLIHDFPTYARYSFLVLLFSLIEKYVEAICDEIEVSERLPIGAKDLKGDALERSMLFLDKMVGISRDNIPAWPEITDLAKIRHCIVHSFGRVDESRDQTRLKNIAKQGVGMTIPNEYVPILFIGSDYCLRALETAIGFFQEILSCFDYEEPDSPIIFRTGD